MQLIEILVIIAAVLFVAGVIVGTLLKKRSNRKKGIIGCSSCASCPHCSSCASRKEPTDDPKDQTK